MDFIKAIFILLYLLFLTTKTDRAFAGTEVGNGGFVVKCLTPAGEKVTFYDLYKFLNTNPAWQPEFDISGRDEYDVANKILENYSKLDPESAAGLQLHVARTKDIVYTTMTTSLDGKINQIGELVASKAIDYSHGRMFKVIKTDDSVALPRHCQKIQALSYLKSVGPIGTGGIYIIKRQLYDSLDLLNKGTARVHESLYDEYFSVPWEGIYENIVSYNQFLLSLPDLTKANDHELLRWQAVNVMERAKNHFSFSYYSGHAVYANFQDEKSCPISLYENGLIKNIRLQSVSSPQLGHIILAGCAEFDRTGALVSIRSTEGSRMMTSN